MKNKAQQLLFSLFLLLLPLLFVNMRYSQNKNAELYKVISSGTLEAIEAWLNEIGTPETIREKACKGVLMMRSAEMLKTPADKLSAFKEGSGLLEAAIAEEPQNTEYRFFRLLIQENAPKMLGYYRQTDEDGTIIIRSYSMLSEDLKNAILAYSKTSKVLNSEDLE